jgi:protein involved in polysaccharide export with SLBB domain
MTKTASPVRLAALVGVLAAGLAAFLVSDGARSQTQDPSTAISDLLKQQMQSSGIETPPPSYLDQVTTLRPNLPNAYRIPAGPLEKAYSKRAGTELREFGYESFGRPSEVSARLSGALQDSYVLGSGDQIIVNIRGQDNQSYRVSVNRDGTLVLPRLPPIAAAGRRFGDFRREVEQRVGEAYTATQAYVAVGTVRQLMVIVAGEVNVPGTLSVNALNSPIDALLLAGGIKKSGSLRNIVVQREGKELAIDLYAVLAGENSPLETSLADGDRIIVPPIGPTVAIVGEVARPGIYELAPGVSSMDAQRLVKLAGGYLVGGAKRLSVLRVHPDGTEAFEPGGSAGATKLRTSEILFVLSSTNVARGRLAVEGHLRIPGTYDLARTPSLRALLASSDVFEEDPFVLFAVVSRKDPATLSRSLIPFAPIQVLRGQQDLALQDDDVVRIFGSREIRELVIELAAEKANRDLSMQDLRSLRSLRPPDGTGGQQQPGQARPGSGQDGNAAAQALSQGTVGAALAGQQNLQIGQIGIPQQKLQELLQTYQQAYGAEAYSDAPVGPGQGRAGDQQVGGQIPTPQGQRDLTLPGYKLGVNGELVPTEAYPAEESIFPDVQEARAYTKPKFLTSRNLIVNLRDPAVRNQLANYRTSVLGAVELPGEYLIAPGVGLDAVVGAVGGLTIAADLTGVEITSTAFDSSAGTATTSRTSFSLGREELGRIKVQPNDVVRIRELYSDRDGGQIILRGQLRFPGRFDLLRGERLSSVIARAGGLTDIAYPYGAVFTRRSAARAEEDGYRRAAQELERQFTVIVADQNIAPQGIQFIRDTIDRLQQAEGVGRISVEVDPAKLTARPERDTILEPDDFLFLPRRPNAVSVTGEVLSAGSYLFSTGRGGSHYIRLAGGFGPAADRGRTFVLMPDGTARPLYSSILSFGSTSVVPGATVIVPRDLRPFRFRQFALDVSQIFSQLAVSAASIAVISRN